jgi:thymidylate synthase
MFTHMRSNDAFLGLPHDVFAFTMLQEAIARTLGVGLGIYSHSVGSLHLYKAHRPSARQYIKEGIQRTSSMRPMPLKDPWSSIRKVVWAERRIRTGHKIDIAALRLNPYWEDFVRLLKIYWHFTRKEGGEMSRLKADMSSRLYDLYIDEKRLALNKRA